MNKLEVRSQILQCDVCSLNESCTSPVPFSGSIPARVAVIGEAPDPEDDRLGVAGGGAASKFLAECLAREGFQDICWINVVSCLPTLDGRPRIPFASEINACSKNLLDQVRACAPAYVVLAGRVPLQSFWPGARTSVEHGKARWWNGIMMFPIYNPRAAMRNPLWKKQVQMDLAALREIVNDLEG